MVCRAPNCDRVVLSRELCQMHYDRRRRYPDVPLSWVRPVRKPCATCGATFDVGPTGTVPELCKPCRKAAHAVRMRADRRRKQLEYQYGMTLDDYDAMFKAQNGVCAICGVPPIARRGAKNGRLCVDHNHDTGQVRALLCSTCNSALGGFRDDPNLLRTAALYLEEHDGV